MKIPNRTWIRSIKALAMGVAFSMVPGLTVQGQPRVTNTFSLINVDHSIPDGSSSGLISTTNVFSSIGSISSVRVRLKVTGEFNGDLYAYLRHSSSQGTNIAILINRPGRISGDVHGYDGSGLNVVLTADAGEDIHLYGTHTNLPLEVSLQGTWQSDGRATNPHSVVDTSARTRGLGALNGFEASGEWTLFIADLECGGTNMLSGWELELEGLPAAVLSLAPVNPVTREYQLRFDGIPNSSYDIETATSLEPPNWQVWITRQTDDNGILTVSDFATNALTGRFYRTVYKQ